MCRIAVVGPDGSGKSTLLEKIASALPDLKVVRMPELRHRNGISENAAALQAIVTLTPYLIRTFLRGGGITLFERCAAIDFQVYGKVYGKIGRLLGEYISSVAPLPSHVLYLDIDIATALSRISKDKHQHHETPERMGIIIERYQGVLNRLVEKSLIELHEINARAEPDKVYHDAMNIIGPLYEHSKKCQRKIC
ncbi:MAG TPA: hypothetical protein VFF28_07935 [Candidatus Nanoarchaeia archaeon]|nr:hypothetical protein [Candidatus Nanoarchaeia archaeon]